MADKKNSADAGSPCRDYLERFDAVTATLVIGTVWGLWHLPLFMLEGSGQYGSPFVHYVVSTPALSILFTWMYLGTGHSVLLAMILHASYNTSTVYLPGETPTATFRWVFAGLVVDCARAGRPVRS